MKQKIVYLSVLIVFILACGTTAPVAVAVPAAHTGTALASLPFFQPGNKQPGAPAEQSHEQPRWQPTSTQQPTSTRAIIPTTGPSSVGFSPGTYLVGKELKPGIYKGLDAGCYWERLKDTTGNSNAILANANTAGQFYIQVKGNDFALSTSCPIALINTIHQHSGAYPQTLKPGEYLVGADIPPGTYKGQDAGCYWERLRDVTGDSAAILANENTTGQFYVQIKTSDFALFVSCEVTRTGN